MSHIDLGVLLALILLVLGLKRRVFGVLGVVLLAAWAFPPAAILHSWTLEARYPAQDLPAGDAEVIVVVSGGLHDVSPTNPQPLANESTYRRTMHAAWLYKHWQALPVVVTGGPIGNPPKHVVVSDVMARILLGEGVPTEMIWHERESLTTHENARYTVAMLRDKGVRRAILVTEGRHMLRAEASFRKQGLDVVPAPCCFSSTAQLNRLADYIPSWRAIRDNEACLHEWLGLAWYWIRGRI